MVELSLNYTDGTVLNYTSTTKPTPVTVADTLSGSSYATHKLFDNDYAVGTWSEHLVFVYGLSDTLLFYLDLGTGNEKVVDNFTYGTYSDPLYKISNVEIKGTNDDPSGSPSWTFNTRTATVKDISGNFIENITGPGGPGDQL